MDDKQFIATLKNIKDMCESTKCKDCKFVIDDVCQIYEISKELGFNNPSQWDIEELERIINK